MQRLIDLSKQVRHLHHKVRLTVDALMDIEWWIKFLPSWNGKSVFYNTFWTDSNTMHLYSDASNVALAAYFDGQWFVVPFEGSLAVLSLFSINWREMCAVALAVSTWGSQWQGQRIIMHCDNMCVVECINHGASRSPDIMRLIRNMFFVCAQYGIEVTARYVNTKCNDIADSLSRLQFERFYSCAPMADKVMTHPDLSVL